MAEDPKMAEDSKKAAGRPTLAPEDKRSEKVRVLVTPSEKIAMEALAKRRGLTASTWLRSLGLDALAAAERTD
jgi:hypothetical protein